MLIRVKGQGRGVKFLGLEVILGQFYRASKKPSPLVFENVKNAKIWNRLLDGENNLLGWEPQ